MERELRIAVHAERLTVDVAGFELPRHLDELHVVEETADRADQPMPEHQARGHRQHRALAGGMGDCRQPVERHMRAGGGEVDYGAALGLERGPERADVLLHGSRGIGVEIRTDRFGQLEVLRHELREIE